MTHRLLGSKRWTQHNFQRLTGGPATCNWTAPRDCTRLPPVGDQMVRAFSMFCVHQSVSNESNVRPATHRPTVGTGFSSQLFTTQRPQSTTPGSAAAVEPMTRESLLKKRKRFRTKFAELIQSNNAGLLTNSTATVKKLKHKQLTTFINQAEVIAVAATIPDGIGSALSSNAGASSPVHRLNGALEATTATSKAVIQCTTAAAAAGCKPEYIRGKKMALIEMGAGFGQKFELTDEEMPFLFVGKKLVRFERGSVEVQQIVDSYVSFKELSGESEDALVADEAGEYMDNMHAKRTSSSKQPNYALDELDLLDPIAASANNNHSTAAADAATTGATPSGAPSKGHHKSLEHELLARHKSLIHNLTIYLGICVHNHGMINRGLSTLLSYRSRCKKSDSRLNIADVQLYNILLAGFGSAANLDKIRDILAIMREDKVAATPATYAAVFECLGRMADESANASVPAAVDSVNLRRLLSDYECEAGEANITLNDIMTKTKFVRDRREKVLNAIRIIHPAFQPDYTPPDPFYDNVLMVKLNDHLKPLSENFDPQSTKPVVGSEIMVSKNGFRPADLVALAEKQLQLELDSVITVKSVERFPATSEQVLLYRQRLADLHQRWRQQITAAFHRDLNTLRSQTHSKGNLAIGLFPYLRALEPEDYADILMNEARILSEGSETFSLTVGALYKRIGVKVQSKYYMEMKRRDGILDKTRRVYGDYVHALCGRYSSDNPRQSWQRHVHHAQAHGPSMDIVDQMWPNMTLLGVGRFLFQIMMRDVKIDANALRANSRTENVLPAFYTLFRNEGKYVKEEVKPHPVLAKLYRGSQQETLHFDSNSVPMLCPPQPWSTPQNGGYLLARSDLIRLPNQAHQQWERIARTNPVHMYPSLDSLNQLSNIAWRVNTAVLDIILDVFGSGGNKKLDVPQPPSALPPLEELRNDADGPPIAEPSKTDLYNRFRQKLLHRRKQSEMYSLWCDTLYRLSLANHFRDKVFWLPHNMDFRGRVYPIPPHLNHLGSDLARCLLVFNQERPLGADGFAWLKLHCINLTGFKKKHAVAERLAYADECMADILDSADRPLDGRMWWSTSDEPWQTLATCIEIARVLRSGLDPADCPSSFPIHQDGSCNGLQHYAALGRDSAGAVSVNLAPCAVPQDVYSDVAGLVEEARRTDAEAGVEVARILDGFIRRAVIKQTVMTTVYGVTRFGARTQIARQLKDIDEFPRDWVWPASTYLTTKTFESLREMFTSTREIQDWFTHCARLISGVGGHNVAWTTPLGLPVVQPYNRFEYSSNPKSNRLTTEQMHIDTHLKPNVMKQKNAFPPNFIHSLDSSHMMLTSLHCEKNGLTFMSVHDCYWTHGCSVSEMNRVCREQFVALHSQPILEELSADLAHRYGYPDREFANDGSVLDSTRHKLNRALLQLPGKGDFDLRNVLDSVYFFS